MLFVIPVLAAIAVVVVAAPQPSGGGTGLFVLVVGLVAVIDFAAVFWIRSVGTGAILGAESNAEIRDAYLRRMILACAFATVPAVLAFAFAIVVGTTLVFFVIAPIFDETGETIRFFAASRGHHADIGGVTPGSMPPGSSTLEEGLHALKLNLALHLPALL